MYNFQKTIPTILLAGIGWFMWGFPFEGRLKMWPPIELLNSLEHPFLFVFWLGVGVGYGILWLIQWVEKNKNHQLFEDELAVPDLRFARTEFWLYLSRAYATWQQANPNRPKTVQKAVEKSNFPSWVRYGRGTFAEDADANFNGSPSEPVREVNESLEGFVIRRGIRG